MRAIAALRLRADLRAPTARYRPPRSRRDHQRRVLGVQSNEKTKECKLPCVLHSSVAWPFELHGARAREARAGSSIQEVSQ